MTRVRIASVLLGAGFGFLLSWGQFIDPDRIRDMLLLRDPYMWEMFATAVAVAFVALRLLKRGVSRSYETTDWESQLRYEVANIGRAFRSEDGQEARKAFLEKRKPVFQGR